MLGEHLAPILTEIETAIWEFESFHPGVALGLSKEGFRAAIKIFMAATADQMFALQTNEDIPFQQRMDMTLKFAEELKKLIFTFTGIDTLDLYKEKVDIAAFGSN